MNDVQPKYLAVLRNRSISKYSSMEIDKYISINLFRKNYDEFLYFMGIHHSFLKPSQQNNFEKVIDLLYHYLAKLDLLNLDKNIPDQLIIDTLESLLRTAEEKDFNIFLDLEKLPISNNSDFRKLLLLLYTPFSDFLVSNCISHIKNIESHYSNDDLTLPIFVSILDDNNNNNLYIIKKIKVPNWFGFIKNEKDFLTVYNNIQKTYSVKDCQNHTNLNQAFGKDINNILYLENTRKEENLVFEPSKLSSLNRTELLEFYKKKIESLKKQEIKAIQLIQQTIAAQIKAEELKIKSLRCSYSEYLNSEHWKNKREEALTFYKGKCQKCGINSYLQIHHLHYNSLGCENVKEDLVVLCEKCHKEEQYVT